MARTRTSLSTVDKISLGDQINNTINAVAEAASDEDKRAVDALIAKAKAADPDDGVTEMVTFTPAMMAIILIKHNHFNREWAAEKVMTFSDDMGNGRWKKTHQGYAFYTSGNYADGQHRGRAQVVSGTTLTIPTYFSMLQADEGAVDCGTVRTAATTAALNGITKAPEKETLLKAIWDYDKKLKIPNSVPRSNRTEVAAEIKRQNHLLERALDIGMAAGVGVEDALLPDTWAVRAAGICLWHKWPSNRVEALLEELQGGEFADEKEALARVYEFILGQRPPPDKLTAPQELSLVIKAMLLQEQGIIPAKKGTDLFGAYKNPPNPDYPGEDTLKAEAAE